MYSQLKNNFALNLKSSHFKVYLGFLFYYLWLLKSIIRFLFILHEYLNFPSLTKRTMCPFLLFYNKLAAGFNVQLLKFTVSSKVRHRR